MAGRTKQGLDYAAWSTDIFDNDTKIDKLLDAQGWYGFDIYFYLCMRAMGSNGYYYKWCYDDCASTARKMGGGISAGTVKEAVDYCLQIGLFNRVLFDEWGVLTSRGIQRSYWLVLKTRRSRRACEELWLLEKDECEGLEFVSINGDMSATNDHLQETNSDMQATNDYKVKESKVKESKVNNAHAIDHIERFEDFWSAYPLDKNRHLSEQAYIDVVTETEYSEQQLVDSAKNYAEYCQITGTDKIYHANNFLSKAHFEDYLPERYKKTVPKKAKSSFNDIEQHDYNFEELEKNLFIN